MSWAVMVWLAVPLVAVEAASAPISFTDVGAFLDAVSGDELIFLNFENLPGDLVDGSDISPEVTFSSPEALDPSTVRVFALDPSNKVIGDSGGAAPNGVGPLHGEFSRPVGALKMTLFTTSQIATLFLYDANGTLVGQVFAPIAGGFLGVISDLPISSFELLGGLVPGSDNRDRNTVDNFGAYGVIPEPSTALLVVVGLVFLSRFDSRRR